MYGIVETPTCSKKTASVYACVCVCVRVCLCKKHALGCHYLHYFCKFICHIYKLVSGYLPSSAHRQL